MHIISQGNHRVSGPHDGKMRTNMVALAAWATRNELGNSQKTLQEIEFLVAQKKKKKTLLKWKIVTKSISDTVPFVARTVTVSA